MVFFFTPKKKEDPLDDYSLKKDAVKGFQDAMRMHDKALRDLEVSMRTCIKTMEAVAASLHNLCTDAQVVPVAASVSGALRRGLADITAEEGAECGGTQWEDLREEVEHSIHVRFKDVGAAHASLEASRRRRAKAKKELDSLQAECDKLQRRSKSPTPRPPSCDDAQMASALSPYEEALRRKEEQELEFHRLHREFEDEYAEFMAKLGAAVQDDVRGVTEAVHGVLVAVGYHFRKCQENVSRSSNDAPPVPVR